jgi:hypothetical protein
MLLSADRPDFSPSVKEIARAADDLVRTIARDGTPTGQDEQYQLAAAAYGPALDRLAGACKADRDLRRDLQPEIHFALSARDGSIRILSRPCLS